jgi:hypothetical protein
MKTPFQGPFVPLLRSPEVMLNAMRMGTYLRYKNTLPAKLREFAILIASRQWTQEFEWEAHSPIASELHIKWKQAWIPKSSAKGLVANPGWAFCHQFSWALEVKINTIFRQEFAQIELGTGKDEGERWTRLL